MDSFEYIGLWWLPEKPDRKMTGTLSFTVQNGLRLEIMGALEDIFARLESGKLSKYDVIYGITQKGKFVTVTNCRSYGQSLNVPGISTEAFFCDIAYITHGHFLVNPEAAKFPAILVDFTYLINWTGLNVLREEWIRQESEFIGSKLELRAVEPRRFELDAATLSIGINFGTDSTSKRHRTYKQSSYIKIESPVPLTLEDWLSQYIRPLQDLITLATDHSNAITALSVHANTKDLRRFEGDQKPLDEELRAEIFFRPPFQQDQTVQNIDEHEMLFHLRDVEANLATYLNSWLRTYKSPANGETSNLNKLRAAFSLYFNTRYHPGPYLEFNFLPLAQALEVYQTVRGEKQTDLPDEDFKRQKHEALENVPEQLRSWLDMRLTNNPPLLGRLLELYDLSKDVMAQIVPNGNSFCVKIKDTRNYYTHYSDDKRGKAAQGEEFYYLFEAVSYMLIRLFLAEFGLPSDKCIEIFAKNARFKFIAGEAITKL